MAVMQSRSSFDNPIMSTVVLDSHPQARRVVCKRCGIAFDCDRSGACWCASEDFRMPMLAGSTEDCLCPTCLRTAATAARHKA
jgi:hypothetical protein